MMRKTMEILDLIAKKRDGGELSQEELAFVVHGIDKTPDYQLSALLMAIYLRGMTPSETAHLTMEMANSGETFDFLSDSTVVDLHSTGGVGDKCTLIVCPIVSACGVKVAKMAGRGLGHTGGTIDKLAAFPNFNSALSPNEFVENVNRYGISIMEQTETVTPADRRLYHLRDITGTIGSVPLIASSIMCKKLATGAPNIVLDVMFGSGAFMKTRERAEELASAMVEIGEAAGRKVRAVLTDMNAPLGRFVGNNLEVEEAINALKGYCEPDLAATCTELAVAMLELGLGVLESEAVSMINSAITSGAALAKFREMVEAQGGEWREEFPRAPKCEDIELQTIDAYEIGEMARRLGAGRLDKNDEIDLSVGIEILDKSKCLARIFRSRGAS